MIWRPHVTVAAVVEQDGRFLLVEEDTADGVRLNQPAGHLEPNESLIDAVIREALEETAWEFVPESLIGVYLWPHPTQDLTYLRFAFCGHLGQHHADRPLDNGIRRTLWMGVDELASVRDQHRSPQVERTVRDYLAGRRVPLDVLDHIGPQR